MPKSQETRFAFYRTTILGGMIENLGQLWEIDGVGST